MIKFINILASCCIGLVTILMLALLLGYETVNIYYGIILLVVAFAGYGVEVQSSMKESINSRKEDSLGLECFE